VLEPLLNENPEACVIANRTVSRAEELADLFSDLGEISAGSYSDLVGSEFDLIINGTSASLQGELPPLPENILAKGAMCYDMMYSKTPTAFVKWGQDCGAKLSVDGLGMLIEQAAESFFIWRGVRPDTNLIISSFRA
jgi:shikimate dehydrogenase